MRKFLTSKKFVEVETPTLVKRTPEAGQQFIVPTHLKNRFYSLVRSPLQLKQLLMVGSLDRCFQIARCYSDENTNSERQPEFTQLHIALSFTDSENLMRLTEDVFIASWPNSETAISTPFPRMTYDEAIEKYGWHKPSLLNKLLIYDLKNYTNYAAFTYMFIVPQVQASSRKWRQRFDSLRFNPSVDVHVVKARSKEKTYSEIENIFPDFQNDIFENHFTLDPSDLIVFSEGPTKEDTLKALGACRCAVIDHLGLIEELTKKGIYDFVWIVNPPLFETNELGELKSAYHPFTRPRAVDDAGLIPDQTMKLRSLAYNLILNGSEIVCASLCNHDVKLQKAIFKLLNIREEDYDYLLEALEMGCPPHGVIALDVDRLLAFICGCKSVQDVIAFPKADDGEDLMTGCPSDVPLADKIRYHIYSADYANKDLSECYV